MATWKFEKELWSIGFSLIAGMDEVGRGSFAGPVVAGCVVFSKANTPSHKLPIKIDDSKKLKDYERELASRWIKDNVVGWGIGEASASLINRIGIVKASQIAFRRAISQVNTRIDFLLIDAFFVPFIKGIRRKKQKPIINGDEKSISIAAASIIAKVHRDSLMETLSKKPKFKVYGWERNKGYGTAQHQAAIRKYGITRHHRKKFVETFLNN